MSEFASNLKSIREDRGYTQKDLARITGISEKSIQRWEQGREKMGSIPLPNAEYLLLLAEALDITPEYLLRGEHTMNTYTAAIRAELIQLQTFEQLKQIKNAPLNATILSHLELSEELVTEIKAAWERNALFEKSCYRNYVRDIILKYCQNRKFYRELFGLEDGMLINIKQS